jgi:hypothetical protein
MYSVPKISAWHKESYSIYIVSGMILVVGIISFLQKDAAA